MKTYRSLFLSLTLIVAGVLGLLISVGQIPSSSLWGLLYSLPYLLITLGAGLILRGIRRQLGSVIPPLILMGTFIAVLYAPQFGWTRALDLQRVVNRFIAGAIPGSGKIVTETRALSEFDAITIGYPGAILIRQGDKNYVTVEADDNLLPQLATRVENGTLIIENKEDEYFRRVAPTQIVKVNIMVKDLKQLVMASEGRLELSGLTANNLELSQKGDVDTILTGLDVDSLAVYLSEGGKVTATGKSNNLFLSIAKHGEFDGTDQQTLVADIQIGGTATATARVEDELHASLSGVATLNYYGSPNMTQESISGAGSVNKLGG